MPLPSNVRVKLSSEVAESISITPVVVREIPIRELIEHMIGITGKDEGRVHELLLRGTLVSGASRFRWAGWDADRRHWDTGQLPDPIPSGGSRRAGIRAALRVWTPHRIPGGRPAQTAVPPDQLLGHVDKWLLPAGRYGSSTGRADSIRRAFGCCANACGKRGW